MPCIGIAGTDNVTGTAIGGGERMRPTYEFLRVSAIFGENGVKISFCWLRCFRKCYSRDIYDKNIRKYGVYFFSVSDKIQMLCLALAFGLA